jgi:antitoxin VapB
VTAHETKTFKSGNSEAVRLPQGVGFGVGVAVHVAREGDRVVITPARADLKAIDAPPDGVQKRDPFEFPERTRL